MAIVTKEVQRRFILGNIEDKRKEWRENTRAIHKKRKIVDLVSKEIRELENKNETLFYYIGALLQDAENLDGGD